MRSEINITRPRLPDGLLLLSLVVVTALSPRLFPVGAAGDVVIVKTPGTTREIPLDIDGRYPVTGPLGTAFLVIKDGQAHLENSPCPLKIGEGMGPISRSGEIIVCVPNRIVATIPGPEEVDAVSR